MLLSSLTSAPKGKSAGSLFNDTGDLYTPTNYPLYGTMAIILLPSNYYLAIKLICRLVVRQQGNKR